MTHIEKFHPRLIIAIIIGTVSIFALPATWRLPTRSLVAWDCGVALYLTFIAVMMFRSTMTSIKNRAAHMDERGLAILLLITLCCLASIIAIVAELSAAKAQGGHIELKSVALTAATVLLSWSFLHTAFALHYAHDFYQHRRGTIGGLEFPGEPHPDYWDFMYQAFIIGTACATADVNVTSRSIRRVTTIHCILSFFFNTTILGLTVNIAAGLF